MDKKQKAKQSLFSELFRAIIGLLLGDASSRIGFAILSLILGILCLTLTLVDMDGTEIKKYTAPYIMGFAWLLLSIGLVISWIRKRRTKQD